MDAKYHHCSASQRTSGVMFTQWLLDPVCSYRRYLDHTAGIRQKWFHVACHTTKQ